MHAYMYSSLDTCNCTVLYASFFPGNKKMLMFHVSKSIKDINRRVNLTTVEHSSPLYKNSKILKLIDLIKLNNILFVYDQINNNLPNAFKNYFQLKRQQHNQFTIGKTLNVHRLIHLSMAPIR